MGVQTRVKRQFRNRRHNVVSFAGHSSHGTRGGLDQHARWGGFEYVPVAAAAGSTFSYVCKFSAPTALLSLRSRTAQPATVQQQYVQNLDLFGSAASHKYP
eukprot:16616-Heterococcus_DN1.PRE.4